MSDDLYEYAKLKSVYNVPDVAVTIFSMMLEQEMKHFWFVAADERKAMIHECFLWAKDFCDEVKNWEEDEEE